MTVARWAFLAAAALTGCSESVPVAPPVIHYGQDLCAACGMIISDDRFAAALVRRAPGGLEARAFDDVGCLLADEAAAPDRLAAGRWVRDFRAEAWLGAERAVYLHSRQLHSPMAFGLAACADADSARQLAAEFPGQLLGFDTVKQQFDAGTLASAPPGRNPP